jgi:choline kinase
LAGISLLDRQIAVLKERGITDITIVAGHCADAIKKGRFRILINPEYVDTNMVETLFCARKIMEGDEDLIITYGDIVYERSVLETLISCDAPVALAVDHEWRRYWELRMDDPLRDAETLKLDKKGMVCELGKKPKGYDEIQAQYIGLIKIRADHVLELKKAYLSMDRESTYDGKDFRNMYMTSFLQYLIDNEWPVRAVQVNNGWLEVDTKADLDLYNRMQQEGTLKKYYEVNDIQ